MQRVILSLLLAFGIAVCVTAQEIRPEFTPEHPRSATPPPRRDAPYYGRGPQRPPRDAPESQVAQRSDTEIYLSYAVLVFALIIIALQSAVMLKAGKGWGPQSTRVFGITLTVTMGTFLITAGYSQNQIAPMMGILGTLLGYLLGQTKPEDERTRRS